MIYHLLILAASLAVLIYSADVFIDSVIVLARQLRISRIVISLTVVAIGTSLPEVMSSGVAAWRGHPEIAIGNVVGSNICNVGLILGLPALFFAIQCRRRVLVEQGGGMLAISIFVWLYSWLAGGIGRVVGGIFLLCFALYIYMVFRFADGLGGDPQELEAETAAASRVSNDKVVAEETVEVVEQRPKNLGWLVSKMIIVVLLLLGSSDRLVASTIELARMIGVSEGIIALSMVALGTSLPELSVSITAARKNQGDILIGNIFGSNVSNLLLVLGTAAIIEPYPVRGLTLIVDFPLMIFLAVLMLVFLYSKKGIDRPRGILLLCVYALMIVRCIVLPQ